MTQDPEAMGKFGEDFIQMQITNRQKELMWTSIQSSKEGIEAIITSPESDPLVAHVANTLINSENQHEIPDQYFKLGIQYGIIEIMKKETPTNGFVMQCE